MGVFVVVIIVVLVLIVVIFIVVCGCKKPGLFSIRSRPDGVGPLVQRSRATTTTSPDKTRGNVAIVATRRAVAVSSRTGDLGSSLKSGGLLDCDGGIATTWPAVEVICGLRRSARVASSRQHDLFLLQRDSWVRRSGTKENRKTDVGMVWPGKWYSLSGRVVWC
jgi:hypothetical protein